MGRHQALVVEVVEIHPLCEGVGIEKSVLKVIIWHHIAFLLITNSDTERQIFLTTLTQMMDFCLFLAHRIRISEILPWVRKSYLTHAILPRLT